MTAGKITEVQVKVCFKI